MSDEKVWYAVTGSSDGHGHVIAIGHSFKDLLEELKYATPPEAICEIERNDQSYISIQYAELEFGVPERR